MSKAVLKITLSRRLKSPYSVARVGSDVFPYVTGAGMQGVFPLSTL